ncbi:MAG: hypothetical protein OES32_06420 [Acidobacteriota bacterium]|nr:hypothetical protein [Acidobacteriota bacterium]MDH3523203.1 hypothetical protein [Acidobacteriota bacterium]
MLLPGGVWRNGEWLREFAFEPLTGAIELALATIGEPGRSRPEKVTAALAAALREVGGSPATPESVRRLTIADRQFLTRQLAAQLGRDGLWLTARCGHCDAHYDFYVEQSILPAKQGRADSPYVTVETSRGRCRLRLPTGADQEAVAALDEPDGALAALVERCLVAVGESEVDAEDGMRPPFDDDDLERIDRALEEAAPEVTLWVQAACPECAGINQVWVDPYACLEDGGELFVEIHQLAMGYHWSESDILSLTPARRRLYLRLLDAERKLVQ